MTTGNDFVKLLDKWRAANGVADPNYKIDTYVQDLAFRHNKKIYDIGEGHFSYDGISRLVNQYYLSGRTAKEHKYLVMTCNNANDPEKTAQNCLDVMTESDYDKNIWKMPMNIAGATIMCHTNRCQGVIIMFKK